MRTDTVSTVAFGVRRHYAGPAGKGVCGYPSGSQGVVLLEVALGLGALLLLALGTAVFGSAFERRVLLEEGVRRAVRTPMILPNESWGRMHGAVQGVLHDALADMGLQSNEYELAVVPVFATSAANTALPYFRIRARVPSPLAMLPIGLSTHLCASGLAPIYHNLPGPILAPIDVGLPGSPDVRTFHPIGSSEDPACKQTPG